MRNTLTRLASNDWLDRAVVKKVPTRPLFALGAAICYAAPSSQGMTDCSCDNGRAVALALMS